MKIESQIEKISSFQHLELLANQIVEGFISGMHKSPFHGFSAEFAEHKVYNVGESTKHIDWKLFAKTDRLFTKGSKKKLICAATSSLTIRRRCTIQSSKTLRIFTKTRLDFLFWLRPF